MNLVVTDGISWILFHVIPVAFKIYYEFCYPGMFGWKVIKSVLS